MNKKELFEKMSKLHPKMLEYINYGLEVKFFNSQNISSIVEKLEKVQFEVDNSIPGDAQTVPVRDGSGRIIIKQNEKRMYDGNKPKYFADEVLFHEFAHVTNGIYESWFHTLDAWRMKDKISTVANESEMSKIRQLFDKPEFRQVGYGWGLLDDFVAQFVAQNMVEKKYNSNDIYRGNLKVYYACNPSKIYFSDLADYPIYRPVAVSFIEALYGEEDIKRFCTESFDKNIVDKILATFASRKNGAENIYKILGYMGNIDFAENTRLGHFDIGTLNQDYDMSARDPDNLYKSFQALEKLLQAEKKVVKKDLPSHPGD